MFIIIKSEILNLQIMYHNYEINHDNILICFPMYYKENYLINKIVNNSIKSVLLYVYRFYVRYSSLLTWAPEAPCYLLDKANTSDIAGEHRGHLLNRVQGNYHFLGYKATQFNLIITCCVQSFSYQQLCHAHYWTQTVSMTNFAKRPYGVIQSVNIYNQTCN